MKNNWSEVDTPFSEIVARGAGGADASPAPGRLSTGVKDG